MKLAIRRSNLKTLMLPISMLGGILFYQWMEYITFISPYLIFLMLFITYCKLTPADIKPDKFEWTLLVTQIVLTGICYALTFFWNRTLSEGVFICFFISTATAAPVITSMLGGSISKVATYSLMTNTVVAVIGPLVLAAVGEHTELTFGKSFLLILKQVFPLIIGPLLCAFIVRKVTPKFHSYLLERQQISFYLWAVSLFIVVGSCVSFAINHWTPDSTSTMILLALGALIACVSQFKIGRVIGRKFNQTVSGGQALGQKNTVLAVWLALAYMNPIASIAPASYVAWQNIINSYQLIRHSRRISHEQIAS